MAEKTKKPGLFKRIGKFFRDYHSEFKKLVWPTKQQLWRNSIATLVSIVVFGAFLAGIDWLFSQGFIALGNWFALLF